MQKHKNIGFRIRISRGKTSQASFAKKLQISLPALQRYEYGERVPPGMVLAKIAEHMGKPVDWILTGKDTSPDSTAEDQAIYHSLDKVSRQILEELQYIDHQGKVEILRLVKKERRYREMLDERDARGEKELDEKRKQDEERERNKPFTEH